MSLAPIALFIYRRPEHTRRTLESLLACQELTGSPLYIFCDGPKTPDVAQSVSDARRVAHELAPSATFVERQQNLGLARSVIDGVTELVNRFGRVIVVEDDLVVAPAFLRFMNQGLERYAADEAVMQISGYQFPVEPPLQQQSCLLSFPSSWGWATWARAWKHFEPDPTRGYETLRRDRALRRRFDLDGTYHYYKLLQKQIAGEIDSWAIRWHLSTFLRGGLVLYPGRSLVRNIGFDGSGTHRGGFQESVTVGAESGWAMPEVALDTRAQKRVYSFLAGQRWQYGSRHVKQIIAKWKKAIQSNGLLGKLPSIRELGRDLLVRRAIYRAGHDTEQDLDIYWDPKMAAVLDTWGIGNAWNEIQLLLLNQRGTVIDIACGTGKVMTLLAAYPELEVHGFDISDFLLQKAIDRGIPRDRLKVSDATKTDYPDNAFDYGYSNGSLEHFTEDGIRKFVTETYRITRDASFHQIPTARSGRNEGWMKTRQSFHNNSVDWWVERYKSAYSTVHVLDSAWNDGISVGKWFVCVKQVA